MNYIKVNIALFKKNQLLKFSQNILNFSLIINALHIRM